MRELGRKPSACEATSASARRTERVVVISVGLGLAPWGVLPWAIYVLAVTAWITVAQRVWSVRSQLRDGA